MANVDGAWETVTKTPMGDMKAVMTITTSGDSFTGTVSGPQGSMTMENGKISGNKLTWTMNMTSPMPMKLEGEVTVDGDKMTGGVKAGAFGTQPMSGARKA